MRFDTAVERIQARGYKLQIKSRRYLTLFECETGKDNHRIQFSSYEPFESVHNVRIIHKRGTIEKCTGLQEALRKVNECLNCR